MSEIKLWSVERLRGALMKSDVIWKNRFPAFKRRAKVNSRYAARS